MAVSLLFSVLYGLKGAL